MKWENSREKSPCPRSLYIGVLIGFHQVHEPFYISPTMALYLIIFTLVACSGWRMTQKKAAKSPKREKCGNSIEDKTRRSSNLSFLRNSRPFQFTHHFDATSMWLKPAKGNLTSGWVESTFLMEGVVGHPGSSGSNKWPGFFFSFHMNNDFTCFHNLSLGMILDVFIAPRHTWGPIYGSGSLKLTELVQT